MEILNVESEAFVASTYEYYRHIIINNQFVTDILYSFLHRCYYTNTEPHWESYKPTILDIHKWIYINTASNTYITRQGTSEEDIEIYRKWKYKTSIYSKKYNLYKMLQIFNKFRDIT